MSKLEEALWQAFDGSLVVSEVAKHANHDQKSHGNWAKDRPSSSRLSQREQELEPLLEEGRRYKNALFMSGHPLQRGNRLEGGALIEALTGAKAEEVLLVADGIVSNTQIVSRSQNVGVTFFREQSFDLIREEIAKVEALIDDLTRAVDFEPRYGSSDSDTPGMPTLAELFSTSDTVDSEPDWAEEATDVIPALKAVREQLQSHLVGSQLLAESVDLDLLATPPPAGKITSWADSVADNPDGGAGFLEGVKHLALTPFSYGRGGRDGVRAGNFQDARALVTVAAGELLSAHIRKATSGDVEDTLDSRVGSSPEAYQQERPLSDLEFSDPLFDLLPPSTLSKVSNVMDVVLAGVSPAPILDADRGRWRRLLSDQKVSSVVKHSVSGRIAERMYGQAKYSDGTPMTDLSYLYRYSSDQARGWAQSAASRDSALLQQVVADTVGRPESFDRFAERQNHTRMSENRFTALNAQYAQAVYAETQALLDIDPAEVSVRAARGTVVAVGRELDLPVKVVEKAIDPTPGSQRSRLSDSMWKVSTDTIGRQPLSSWSTSTQVAHSFANLNPDMNGSVPTINGYAIVQRAVIPDSQIFSTALTGPGCLHEQEIIAIEGTTGETSASVLYGAFSPEQALSYAQGRDADGDGWIYEGTDQEMFVGKADQEFEYNREVPEQNRKDVASLLTWIPDGWDAAYLIDEPS